MAQENHNYETFGIKRSVPGGLTKMLVDKRAVGHYTYKYASEFAMKATITAEIKYEILKYVINANPINTTAIAEGVLTWMDSTASGDMIRSYTTGIDVTSAMAHVRKSVPNIPDAIALLLVRTAYELKKVALVAKETDMLFQTTVYEPALIGSVLRTTNVTHFSALPAVDMAIRHYLDAIRSRFKVTTDSAERIQWDKSSFVSGIADALDDMLSEIMRGLARADILARSAAVAVDWHLAHPEEVRPQVVDQLCAFANITKKMRPLVPTTRPTATDLSNAQTYYANIENFVKEFSSHFEIRSIGDIANAFAIDSVSTDLIRPVGKVFRLRWACPVTIGVPTAFITHWSTVITRKVKNGRTTSSEETSLAAYKITRDDKWSAYTKQIGDFASRASRLMAARGTSVIIRKDADSIDIDHRLWFDLLDTPYPAGADVEGTVKRCFAILKSQDVYLDRIGGDLVYAYYDTTAAQRNDGNIAATRRLLRRKSWRDVAAGTVNAAQAGTSLFTHTAILNLASFSKSGVTGRLGCDSLPDTLIPLTTHVDSAGVYQYETAPRLPYKAYLADGSTEDRQPILNEAFGYEAIALPNLYAEIPLDCVVTLKYLADALSKIHAMTSVHDGARKLALDITRIAHDIAAGLFGSYANDVATSHLAAASSKDIVALMTLADEEHAWCTTVSLFSGWLGKFNEALGKALAALVDDVRAYYEPDDVVGTTYDEVLEQLDKVVVDMQTEKPLPEFTPIAGVK